MNERIEAEIVKDSYDNLWLCLKNQDNEERALEINSIEEVQAIKNACLIFLEGIDEN